MGQASPTLSDSTFKISFEALKFQRFQLFRRAENQRTKSCVSTDSTTEANPNTIKKAFLLRRLGAENETRTRDPDLGKVVLYQLSYFRVLMFCL
jgi:hypothetical protein